MLNSIVDEDVGVRRAVEAIYHKGFGLHSSERYAEACSVFRAMLRVAPSDERGWLALGICHEKLGQRRIALELYSAGTVAAAPAPRCLLSRFRVLYDMNRAADAQRAYDDALQIAISLDDEGLVAIIQNERLVRP